ncbi:hypothetical protein QM306_40835, partial [Burkholderia cenocepacia]|nr:hypothetical protein [Burkholderia cenocepacia]
FAREARLFGNGNQRERQRFAGGTPQQQPAARERPGVAALMTAADLRSPAARAQRLRVFYGLSSAEADLAVL